MPDGQRITVPLELDSAFGLLLVPLKVGDSTLSMFISGSPVSGIASARWQDLLIEEHLIYPDFPASLHILDGLSIAGTPIPRLEVRRSRRASRFELDGELGLNFFQNFREVSFRMPAGPDGPILLTLELPPRW